MTKFISFSYDICSTLLFIFVSILLHHIITIIIFNVNETKKEQTIFCNPFTYTHTHMCSNLHRKDNFVFLYEDKCHFIVRSAINNKGKGKICFFYVKYYYDTAKYLRKLPTKLDLCVMRERIQKKTYILKKQMKATQLDSNPFFFS